MRSILIYLFFLFLLSGCTTTVTEFKDQNGDSSQYLDLNNDSVAEGSFNVGYSDNNLIISGNYNISSDSIKLLNDFSAQAENVKPDSLSYSLYNYDTKLLTELKTSSFTDFKKKILDTIAFKGQYAIYLTRTYYGFKGKTATINYSAKVGPIDIKLSLPYKRYEKEVETTMRFH